jgi:DNA invertase Pin-like site-specific DNA recombinase
MRTVIYARYSTERQSDASIADQLRVCREYVASRGWLVASEHCDEGISGAALGNRLGVQQALAALTAGSALIVTDPSRLSRSQDLAPLLTRLRHRGVRVIGVQDGFDSDSRTARMQAGLSGIMSEFRAMVADRIRSALEMRTRRAAHRRQGLRQSRDRARGVYALRRRRVAQGDRKRLQPPRHSLAGRRLEGAQRQAGSLDDFRPARNLEE